MIVATAGHIDHGKTLLVKRLTGIDTDRLPEEKRRGISIDIGFAHLRLPDGSAIGFIDVPGHERFVRNMLAGVSGIDFVLLVVAADDGVMPQTREHLAILDLLDVRQGLLVITKVDRVAPERIEAVTAELRALVADTVLRDAPVLAVSAMTGDGVDALRETLVARLSAQRLGASEGRHFRLAIDRCFTVAGSGTVVTGTIFAGRVKVGDTLSLSPSGVTVRVRGLQVQGRTVEQATAGARCAVNLTGADLQKDSITRGEWLVDPAIHAPTSRIDVHLRALATEANPLRHWTPVHLHLGTADVTGRLSTRRDLSVAPGTAEVAQIVLDQPVGAQPLVSREFGPGTRPREFRLGTPDLDLEQFRIDLEHHRALPDIAALRERDALQVSRYARPQFDPFHGLDTADELLPVADRALDHLGHGDRHRRRRTALGGRIGAALAFAGRAACCEQQGDTTGGQPCRVLATPHP